MSTQDHDAGKIVCRRCSAALDAGDCFCRRCGAPTAAAPADAVQAELATGPRSLPAPWWDNPWLVLVMLFAVLGPLALPMLFRSRRFSLFWKIALTLLTAAATAAVFWLGWYWLYKSLQPLRDALQGR